jgi:hypothetical protein
MGRQFVEVAGARRDDYYSAVAHVSQNATILV